MVSADKNKQPSVLAKLISVILHPFIIATMTYALIIGNSNAIGRSDKFTYFGMALIAVIIIPLLSVLRLKKRGETVSLDVPERSKRINPFLVSIVGYFGVWLLFKIMHAPREISLLMWCYGINTLVATIITRYWKISVHGIALGGPIVALAYLVSPAFYWGILTAPLMVYSRVELRAHTIAQVITGFLLGFFLTLFQFESIL